MITFIVHLKVAPTNAPALEALMDHVRTQTLAHEPGVLFYGFSKSVETPGTYAVVEVYRDAAAHAAHMATPWVTESLAASAALISGTPDVRQYVTPGAAPAIRRTNF